MNILILHNLEDVRVARRNALDYILSFRRYAPEHNFLFHRITLPVTKALRSTMFHAVIFDSTSLGIVTFRPRDLFYMQRDKWSFLSDLPTLKLMFPQDDANHSEILDEWFVDLKCDRLYTVRPNFSSLLYPRTSEIADVSGVLPGYIDDASVADIAKYAKPFVQRKWDIGQRVTMYPARGGRHSRVKGITAEIVKRAAIARGLRVNISTDSRDVLYGDDWFRLLGDCRYSLGALGGMSLWDPRGEISDRIEAFVNKHSNASFEQIEEACFPGLDGQFIFQGITPRVFDAALCRTCQILVEGSYLEEMRPWKHYISLKEDCSNLDEVFEEIKNDHAAENRVRACDVDLVENPRYRYSTMVKRVIDDIQETVKDREGEFKNRSNYIRLGLQHEAELRSHFFAQYRQRDVRPMRVRKEVDDMMDAVDVDAQVWPGFRKNALWRLVRLLGRSIQRLAVIFGLTRVITRRVSNPG